MPVHPLRAKALRRWRESDPKLHAIARAVPPPAPAYGQGHPFEALVQSIAHQQVSLQAGQSIFRRVGELGPTPEALLKAGPEKLRAAGLSRPKVAYVLDLADKAVTKVVDLDHISTMPDEQVIEQLTSVKGIGVWTAKMFLLFHLQRPDVLPHEDLGLQIAVAQHYGVSRKLAAKRIQKMRPAWSPYCSYASLVLWNSRRVEMGVKPR
ncbi:MAG TPA: DNA-3-methyladenine glycosylase 2 family protein [Candidatus Thermoplasmatota archaeon]|nr:DNA-3-methyladenine glycosylase 2 family protein [Candidatus Thermoplasmatota archaeon]